MPVRLEDGDIVIRKFKLGPFFLVSEAKGGGSWRKVLNTANRDEAFRIARAASASDRNRSSIILIDNETGDWEHYDPMFDVLERTTLDR